MAAADRSLPRALLVLLGPGLVGAAILRAGTPLGWSEAVRSGALSYVRQVRQLRLSSPPSLAQHGVAQFISLYNRARQVETPSFVWGDEVEFGVFKRDVTGRFDLSLRSAELIDLLSRREQERNAVLECGCDWQPEYGGWMVESVPRLPYGGYISDLLAVERSMQRRRR